MSYYCGVDIGGTFTDCVLVDDGGTITLAKVPSTPQDFSEGFLDAIAAAAAQRGLGPSEAFGQIELLLHGTTVGHERARADARGQDGADHDPRSPRRAHHDALVRALRGPSDRETAPRLPAPQARSDRSTRADQGSLGARRLGGGRLPAAQRGRGAPRRRGARRTKASKGSPSASSGASSTATTSAASRRSSRELAPDLFVSCAHELIAKPGEYERTAAAAINCYIGPSTSTYVQRLDEATTRERGYEQPLLIMQAAGGVVPAAEVAEAPLFTIGSGPVGGVTGAKFLADVLGHEDVIACDMGGTSFDVGLLHDGQPIASSETVINQYTFFMPRLLIESIGSGGGSIIWVDEQSRTPAGRPRERRCRSRACLLRAWRRPADGHRCEPPARPLQPGQLPRRPDDAGSRGGRARAQATVAEPLGMSPIEAAAGAVRIVEFQMADLMRQMTGRAGPRPARSSWSTRTGAPARAHAAVFARELGCSEVVVPLGDLALDLVGPRGDVRGRAAHLRACRARRRRRSPRSDGTRSSPASRIERASSSAPEGFADDAIEFSRLADMKFSLQIHHVDVPVAVRDTHGRRAWRRQIETFIERYEAIYGEGSAFTGAGVQAGVFRVNGRGMIRTPALPRLEAHRRGSSPSAAATSTGSRHWLPAARTSTTAQGTRPRRRPHRPGDRRDERDDDRRAAGAERSGRTTTAAS